MNLFTTISCGLTKNLKFSIEVAYVIKYYITTTHNNKTTTRLYTTNIILLICEVAIGRPGLNSHLMKCAFVQQKRHKRVYTVLWRDSYSISSWIHFLKCHCHQQWHAENKSVALLRPTVRDEEGEMVRWNLMDVVSRLTMYHLFN